MYSITQTANVSIVAAPHGGHGLVRAVPAATLATLGYVARIVFGAFGCVLIVAGSVCRVLAEPLSIAGRTALILAQGEEVDDA